MSVCCGRPLREVVSWNFSSWRWWKSSNVDLFVRSWVETKMLIRLLPRISVDLFVRSWVETLIKDSVPNQIVRRPLREVVSWNSTVFGGIVGTAKVDLFVRSWVETYMAMGLYWLYRGRPLREVVSWNIPLVLIQKVSVCRPLREVVSWNSISQLCFYIFVVDLFVRSWVETLRL